MHSGRAAALAVLLLSLMFICSPAAIAQSRAYRLRLSEDIGQTSRYRLIFDIEMRAEYAGEGALDAGTRRLMELLAQGMKLRTAVEYEQRLAEVAEDGTHVLDVRWHDYQFKGAIGGEQIPEPPGRAEATRDLLSEVARVRTTPAGRTIDVTFSNPRLAAFARQFAQGGMPTYLPERPVRVGDSWTGVASFPLGTPVGGLAAMEIELVHTLKEVREGPAGPIAVIELSGSYSQLQGMEDVGLGVPLYMEASLTGSSLFDIDEGRFVGGRYEMDMFALNATENIEVRLIGHADGTLELLRAR